MKALANEAQSLGFFGTFTQDVKTTLEILLGSLTKHEVNKLVHNLVRHTINISNFSV